MHRWKKIIKMIEIEYNNQAEDSKKRRIKKCIKDKMINSTIHALPNIYKTENYYFKIMWLLFFIITFSFNIQFTIKCINDYLLYETITEIDVLTDQPGSTSNF